MNKIYWNNIYSQQRITNEASSFAQFCTNYTKKNDNLLELGCGNGRDAIYFAKNELQVVAVDQSITAIQQLQIEHPNIAFKNKDFVFDKEIYTSETFNYIYSRFTLHAISEKEQLIVLKNVYNSLKKDGIFFIEARTKKDEIFGLGEKLSDDEYYYEGHYRRFLDYDKFLTLLYSLGYSIEYSTEENNLSIYGNSNPTLLRVIAKK